MSEDQTVEACERRLREKDTNPKDAVGVDKVPRSCVPSGPVMFMALGMMEGARKYGRHNYRIAGVRASVYFDAVDRHMTAWWEGEDIDPDSGLPHLGKAMASLAVILDAVMSGNWIDDRPPVVYEKGWLQKMNALAKNMIAKYPDAKEPFTEKNRRS